MSAQSNKRINTMAHIVIINIVLLIILLLLLEIGLRSAFSIKDCIKGNDCTFARVLNIEIRKLPPSRHFSDIGITRYSDELGFVPMENFDQIINTEGWNNNKVTINKYGFRANDNENLKIQSKNKILVVGDSFAFGSQVSNNETWSSCLEREGGARVDNGGVFAYGAAQSLKRGIIETKRRQYNLLLLSILVPENFDRDRYTYWQGYPRVPLAQVNGEIKWDINASAKNKIGTKYNPDKPNNLLRFVYSNSLIFAGIFDRLNPNYNFSGNALYSLEQTAPDPFGVMEAIFKKLSEVSIKKYVILQYQENLLSDHDVNIYRSRIMKLAAKYDVEVLDSFEILKKEDARETWNGHYTPYGNYIICKFINKELNK